MSTLHILSYDTSKIALLVKTNTNIKLIYGCYCSLLIPADRIVKCCSTCLFCYIYGLASCDIQPFMFLLVSIQHITNKTECK